MHGDSCPHVHTGTLEFPQEKNMNVALSGLGFHAAKDLVIINLWPNMEPGKTDFFLWVLNALINKRSANI